MVTLLPARHGARFEAKEEVAFVGGQLRDDPDDLTQSANMLKQGKDSNQRAAEHQARLNHVRPDDSFDPAHCRIDAGDDRQRDDRDEVGTDRGHRLLAELHLPTRDEDAIGQHHHE